MQYLHKGSCTELDIGTLGLDHCIVDPPYSEDTHAKAQTQIDGEFVSNDFGFKHLTGSLADHIATACRVASGSSLIFSDHQNIPFWTSVLNKNGCKIQRIIPWIRWSAPSIVVGRPPAMCEFVLLVQGQGKETFHGPGNFGLFEAKALRGADKHKTQKPLDLMLQAVEMFTAPDSRVYDPCMGWGTTGVACALLGRHFMGCEIDAGHYQKAFERLNGPEPQDDDQKRYERFLAWHEAILKDKERIRQHTEKIRGKNEARKRKVQ
jgi:site-specific DNA-methyltransferase (adenine-specific)